MLVPPGMVEGAGAKPYNARRFRPDALGECSPMNDEWFLYTGEETVGPYAEEQLRAMLAAGEISPEHHVRRGEDAWVTAAEALPPHDRATTAAATDYAIAADDEEEETELELSKEQPDVVVEEPEYAIRSDAAGKEESEGLGPVIAVDVSAAKISGSSSFAVGPSTAKRASTAAPRKSKKRWTKDPNVMLAAAIAIGGLAAILVGKLVLWLIRG